MSKKAKRWIDLNEQPVEVLYTVQRVDFDWIVGNGKY